MKVGRNFVYKKTIFDYILIFFLLILAGYSFQLLFYSSKNDNYVVEVYQDNKIVYRDFLSKDNLVHLRNAVVEIKNNKVRMKESSCPYKFCVNTGWIDKPYKQIVCVPNKIYVKILSKTTQGVDGVSY